MPAKRATEETYTELTQAYAWFNERLFGDKLPGALITLTRNDRTMGYFSPERFVRREGRHRADEIAMNPTYFAVVQIEEVLGTLVHEMAHQWQHRFGKPGRARYHNEEWGRRMEDMGLMPSDNGRPGGSRCGEKMMEYPIPGGPFLRACEELLTRDFRISWYDRFVAYVPAWHEYVQSPSTPMADVEPELVVHLEAEREEQAIISAIPWQTLIRDHLVPIRTPARGTVPNSNRVKYTCFGCWSNVWGKAGLHIDCRDCGEPFEPADPQPRE